MVRRASTQDAETHRRRNDTISFSDLDQLFVNATGWFLGLLPAWARPWASMLVAIGAIAAVAPAIMMYLTWLERKWIARM